MAYTQNYGRGNFDKTGNNIPGEFKQNNEPPGTQITKTPKYAEGVQKYQTKLKAEHQNREDFKVNPTTAEASAKPFERTITTEGGMTRIVGSGGQVYYGSSRSKATKDAINESNKKVALVNSQRQKNTNFWNVNAGVKQSSDYTEGDKKMLLNLGKAKVANN